jgi:hypothetical protein
MMRNIENVFAVINHNDIGTVERVLDCGGERSATPLSAVRKRRRRCALPSQSKIAIVLMPL